ncbi:MAG: T9SS type A sorting domain-containing protein, partial [Bacteroidota bacterium]|nr:T9SS type A sorting domain-containing protein [Bacteroidota bacterium]
NINQFLSGLLPSTIPVYFDHCCIEDPNLTATPNANGTFNDDPSFGMGNYGYRISWANSPCRDAGINTVTPISITDLDGHTQMEQRIYNNFMGSNTIDIGSYENFRLPTDPPIISAISKINKKEIIVNCFPNPVNKLLYFKIENNIKTKLNISVFNINGKIVFKGNTDKIQTKIDVSHFESGNYFIYLYNNNFTKTINFLKL